jgi:hypothetical protein
MKESGMTLKRNRKSQETDLQKQHFIHVRSIQPNPINCDPRGKASVLPRNESGVWRAFVETYNAFQFISDEV